jgi:alpha-beta hydrolase superfamily lysophospholipase
LRASSERQRSTDGLEIFVRRWQPESAARATLQIVHGMGEHAARYARLAERLCSAGFEVFAADTRGHGLSTLEPELLGHLSDTDGWNKAVADVGLLAARIAEERPGLPHALLGHSMGSLLVLDFLTRARTPADAAITPVDAAVLSGSSGPPGRGIAIALAVARFERLRLGVRGHSPILQRMLFGRFNRAFEPAETAFDWLSRDRAEVAKYVADPLCGFVLTVGGLCELATALRRLFNRDALARIPHGLPVLLLSGEHDPVHDSLRGFESLALGLRSSGLERLTERVYPDARHELLNETNRDQVSDDLLDWLESQLAAPRL